MIVNHFKIAIRNIIRKKAFSTINIAGLALGLTCSLLIFLWVQDEQNMDGMHIQDNYLYSVYTRSYNEEKVTPNHHTAALLPEELKKAIPEIKFATGFAKELRLSKPGIIQESFQVGDRMHSMKGSRAGADFFQMFSYPLLYGTPETALSNLDGVAISRKMANLFFDSPQAAYGETISFNNESNKRDLVITAVFEDISTSSSMQFDYLTNWDYWVQNDQFKKYWMHLGTYTYIQLEENANPKDVEEKIKHFLDPYIGTTDYSDSHVELGIQKFSDGYLYGNFENGYPADSRIVYVRLMKIIALFILLIACINFMNLSTANSMKKASEVGVRKALGANRKSLIHQFMWETFLMVIIAFFIAFTAVLFLLPWFNQLTGKHVALVFNDPMTMAYTLVILLAVGLLAGSYPSFYLSSFKPSRTLKGKVKIDKKAIGLRKGLVIFQFTLSIILIISTLIFTRQISFVSNSNLGYVQDNILYMPLEGELVPGYLTFKKEAQRIPGIKYVDRSAQIPHKMGLSGPFVKWEGMDETQFINFTPSSVGFDFAKLIGLEIIEGRDFSENFLADTSNFLASKLAITQMGLQDPIGSTITVFGKTGQIVGIYDDFHTESLHQSLRPTILDIKESLNFGTVLVKIEAGKTKETLTELEAFYQRFNPGYSFTYVFLDDEYQQLYESDQVITSLSNIFGGLAVLISCLGLLGLAMSSSEQKVKEIGIRKVFGASAISIITLFSKDFLVLVGIAFVLASPIAWFVLNQWLQGFAYHISLGWPVFVLAGILALLVALMTVSFQAFKAATANPIKSLKSE